MAFTPIEGKPVRLPPGRVEVRLSEEHYHLYRSLYARFRTVLEELPILRDRDFDGRKVQMTAPQLAALNDALAREAAREEAPPPGDGSSPFEGQAKGRSRLFKRLQYLS